MTQLSPDDWFDILAFHQEAGVDVALDDAPVDRFAQSAAEPRRAQASMNRAVASTPAPVSTAGASAQHVIQETAKAAPPPARPVNPAITTSAPDEAELAAREAVQGANSLETLRAIMEAFDGCALKRTASRLVFADGNPQARIMFVGEAPGRDEDQQGLPFVGRAGRLLDLMMTNIGLDRTSAYIANVVPWRPPGNRTPSPQETTICLPFIRRQIELVNPDLLVCLGVQSAQALLSSKEGITRLRGRFMDYDTGTRTIRAIATFHPAYLLRTPIGKRHVWRDLLAIETALKTKVD